jgi:Nucleoside-diphosphate-sugar epimerases
MKSTILITGVAGFLGRNLARHFFELGWEVVGVDIVSPENSPAAFLKQYLAVNLPDPQFAAFLQKVQPAACLHCAGRSSVGASVAKPYEDYCQGPALTGYILNSLHETVPACKFILFSSAAVYGNPSRLPVSEALPEAPISPYGYHKWQSELLCREYAQVYGQPTASVRIFSAYGPGLRRQVLWDICEKAATSEKILLHGTGQESRDFIHVQDITRGIESILASAEMLGEAYNLASGRQVTIASLANMIAKEMQVADKEIIFDCIVPKGDPLYWQADLQKIARLGFVPSIPFEEGLKTYVTWFCSEWGKG